MCVPYTGSEKWTSSLGYAIVDEWRPWYTKDQIQGYVRVFHQLNHAHVKFL